MERTESQIVQVAPANEPEKIKEMQLFGWNLQGRQEVHQEGDSKGEIKPSFSPALFGPDQYVVKTTIHHYVKLHFVRSLNLQSYEDIKRIEDECRQQPFPPPASLKSYLWPLAMVVLGLSPIFSSSKDAAGALPGCLMIASIGGLWMFLKIRSQRKKGRIRAESAKKCQELVALLPTISDNGEPTPAQDSKACPLCGETIKAIAVICRFCNNKIPV